MRGPPTFHHDQVSCNGTTFVEGELDLADALDLDVRRAIAAGEIARHQLALNVSRDRPPDRRPSDGPPDQPPPSDPQHF